MANGRAATGEVSERAKFRQLAMFWAWATAASAGVFLLLAWSASSRELAWLSAAAAAFVALGLLPTYRLSSQDRVEAAAEWLAWSVSTAAVLIVVVLRAAYPGLIVAPLLTSLIGLPHLHGRRLVRVTALGVGGCVLVFVIGAFFPQATELPAVYMSLACLACLCTEMGLAWLLLSQYRNALLRMLTESESARSALVLSEANLERKVEHRTKELAASRDLAEAGSRAKGAFLASLSHEIRTPMNAIIGMAGLLGDGPLNDEQRDYARIILTSGDHLLGLLNEILDYSKLESGKLAIENLAFSPVSIVEEAVDLIARTTKEGIELVYDVAGDVPSAIMGDPSRVRQILLNYLSNAAKFTERGEILVSVARRALDDGKEELHFTVRDTGIGIAADKMDRLFQSFSQVDASISRKYGGTGLGLAISRHLAELMGGRAWAESVAGKGSAFHFTIQTEAPHHTVRKRYPTGETMPLRGLKVWLVDDNDTNRPVLGKQLESWGLVVRDTGLAAEALAWAKSGDACDLVLVDSVLPDMDGLQLAAALHELRGEKLKQLLLSSSGHMQGAAELHPVGISAELQKPIKSSHLFNALLKLFDGATTRVPGAATARSEINANVAVNFPLRILVAEDNAVNLKLITTLLTRMGYRPDSVGTGVEVIAALKRQPYDLILMDVQMPEMDGIEASRRIRKEWEPSQRPRIVALTAGVMLEDRQSCLDAGMEEFLDKPVIVRQLIDALSRSKRLDSEIAGH